MKLYNLKDEAQVVDFETAVKTGLGRNQGLFFPKEIPTLSNIDELLELDVHQRNFQILKNFVSENIDDSSLKQIIDQTFAFPSQLEKVSENEFCLELFHGPTLAFKDFGANFMANCLKSFAEDKPITILTATSGDTGAAVAHAFHGLENIRVVILFPKGKISELQQKMFTTLGDNIHTIAVEGSFDDCQQLVKQSFDQTELVEKVGLNSANSINISRLLAQVCYYFDGFAQLPEEKREQVVVAVPSGNFGNLCAGIIAKTLGLPIKRFIASTNLNDTVPRYLQTGEWSPKETIATISNAMDVSKPNNWPRIEYLMETDQFDSNLLTGGAVNEEQTAETLKALYQQGYTSEPHAAVAYKGLHDSLQQDETGIFLGTAHPAKFKSTVEEILAIELPLPKALADCSEKKDLSHQTSADFGELAKFLYDLK
ncbi:threonine synthase [Aliikangiella coralliicola]|uniref:Threonine synthase n=1 Tax=Aliikangiella coralliicola TaxID=2592383 RepID=A0A545U6J4_9GAMM|nr:threonine synthase [Aliikangiella coralliicola]TQV85054.1 threonine synthase [Aliikangiella coralliicola]